MKLRNLMTAVAFAVALASIGGAQPASPAAFASVSTPKFRVRFIHAAAGVQAVNLRLDRSTLFRRVSYGGGTAFRSLAEGDYWLDVTTPSTETNVLPGKTRDFWSGLDYTILLAGSLSGDPELETFCVEIPTAKVPRTEARVLLIQAVPDAQPMDLLVDGGLVSSGLEYGDFEPPFGLAPGKHTFALEVGGSTVVPAVQINLRGGQLQTLVVTGTADPDDGYPLVLKRYSSY